MKKIAQSMMVLLVVAVTLLSPSLASAQSTGLGVVPRKEFNILPGKSVSDQLTVTNLNKEVALKVSINLVDFKSKGETGTPALILEEDAQPTAWSLKPFITLPGSFEIGP